MEWRIPQKGDKLEIIPAGNYNEAYKSASIDIAKVQEELKITQFLSMSLCLT